MIIIFLRFLSNQTGNNKNLGFWLGDAAVEENWSDMSKDAPKSFQFRYPKV